MKKGLCVAIVLVLALVIGLLVVGCSSAGDTSSTSTSAPDSGASSSVSAATDTSAPVDESTTASSDDTAAVATTTAAAEEKRYEQNDAHLVYSGAWKTSANSAASKGSYAFVDSAGKVTITFDGTHLSLLAKKSPRYGKANITLDGKDLGAIDLYNVDAKYQQKVWGSGNLEAGEHTVVVEWTGTKRKGATASNINIDCVLVSGTLK